jgi:hypothetical protein
MTENRRDARPPDDRGRRSKDPSQHAANVGSPIALGIALGAGIGVALGNVGIGVAVGLALGSAFGAARARRGS